jgi:hypothetical protein
MGLTIHYHIKAAAGIDATEARRLVTAGAGLAFRMCLRRDFDDIGPLCDCHGHKLLPESNKPAPCASAPCAEKQGGRRPLLSSTQVASRTLCPTSSASESAVRKAAACWRTFPVPGRKGSFTGEEVHPLEGFVFRVRAGRDCEPLWLGLCRYPTVVDTCLGSRKTRFGEHWQFSGFTKTQYASLHGWEHFFRCHRAIINLLAAWESLGLAVRITDEAGYWPRRSERVLRRNLDEMNGAIAAAAGTLKDQSEESGSPTGIVAPILQHPYFERLEAEGAQRTGQKLL